MAAVSEIFGQADGLKIMEYKTCVEAGTRNEHLDAICAKGKWFCCKLENTSMIAKENARKRSLACQGDIVSVASNVRLPLINDAKLSFGKVVALLNFCVSACHVFDRIIEGACFPVLGKLEGL